MSFEEIKGLSWNLKPISGDTGHTYMGVKGEQKMFFKRNMTPFTAALSTEHITPRLIWTKRLSNGDILTAQEWTDGRTLTCDEMAGKRVIDMLQHVHHSQRLLHILEEIGGEKYYPASLLNEWMVGLPEILSEQKAVLTCYENLALNQPETTEEMLSVCHGDLNKKNCLLANEEDLYLVDWDNALIADPLYDVGSLFSQYIPKSDREAWMNAYGLEMNHAVIARCRWYTKFAILKQAKDYALADEAEKLQQCLNKLKN